MEKRSRRLACLRNVWTEPATRTLNDADHGDDQLLQMFNIMASDKCGGHENRDNHGGHVVMGQHFTSENADFDCAASDASLDGSDSNSNSRTVLYGHDVAGIVDDVTVRASVVLPALMCLLLWYKRQRGKYKQQVMLVILIALIPQTFAGQITRPRLILQVTRIVVNMKPAARHYLVSF